MAANELEYPTVELSSRKCCSAKPGILDGKFPFLIMQYTKIAAFKLANSRNVRLAASPSLG